MARYLRARYGDGLAPPHIWLGVSVEDAKNTVRLKHLRAARASVKFVSFEPLLATVGKVDLSGINWAIVGGESGPRARPMAEHVWFMRCLYRFWDLLEGVPGIHAHRPPKGSGSTMGGWYAARGLYRAEELGGLPIEKLKFGVVYFQRSNTSSAGRTAWARQCM